MTHVPFQRQTAAALSDLEWGYLFDNIPANAAGAHLYFLEYGVGVQTPSRKTGSELWDQYGGTVISWWAIERPGTRPSCWWKYTAKEPRRRLGGTGDLYSDNHRKLGVPCCWHTETIGPLDHLPRFEVRPHISTALACCCRVKKSG